MLSHVQTQRSNFDKYAGKVYIFLRSLTSSDLFVDCISQYLKIFLIRITNLIFGVNFEENWLRLGFQTLYFKGNYSISRILSNNGKCLLRGHFDPYDDVRLKGSTSTIRGDSYGKSGFDESACFTPPMWVYRNCSDACGHHYPGSTPGDTPRLQVHFF